MVEFVNRLITGVVSLAVMAAVAGALARVPRRADLVWLALGLVAGVIAQILLGAALVLADLDPGFTIGHFLLSAVLVANAVVLAHRAGIEPAPSGTPSPSPSPPAPSASSAPGAPAGSEGPTAPTARSGTTAPRAARRLSAALVVVGAAVLVTGTVVTGAGPHGGDERAARLNLDVADVARTHSLVVWAFLALVVALAAVLGRPRAEAAGADPAALRATVRLLLLSVAQGGVGYLQYLLDVPPLLVGVHVLGATLVWAATVHLAIVVRDGGPARRAGRPVAGTGASRGEVPVLSGR
jgi:cytochrome c oxidase assembly protein subunit 15